MRDIDPEAGHSGSSRGAYKRRASKTPVPVATPRPPLGGLPDEFIGDEVYADEHAATDIIKEWWSIGEGSRWRKRHPGAE
jgi:hypothetical protein